MNEPLFNTIVYNESYPDPQGGTKMGLYYIRDMKPVPPNCRRRCQMCDCGFRATNGNTDVKSWNQCQYEDVDYKNWIEYYTKYEDDSSKILPPEEIYSTVVKYILSHWPETLYYYELSRSGKGFHFIFYFDVERTVDEWKHTKNMSHAIIKKAFIDCGYEDIINFNGNGKTNKVFDSCTDRWNQLIYLTKNEARINSLCSGEIKEYDNLEVIDYKPKRDKYVNNGDEYIITVEKNPLSDGEYADYIDHIQRWNLYNSLRRCYGDDDFEDEYFYCCKHIPEQNGHIFEWYKDYENNEGSSWDKDFSDDCYVSKELLKMFGYTVNFTKKTINKGNTNKELQDCYKNILGLDI